MRKNFLIASWLFGFGNSFSSPLLSLYIYVSSSVYYSLEFILFTSIFILIGYILIGYISNVYNKIITFYKIGIGLYIIFYLVLLALNINAYKYTLLLGSIYGIAQGYYWFAWDVIFYDVSDKMNFFNKSSYLGVISSIISPLVYGTILSIFHQLGYSILFSMTSAILIFVIFLVENININSKFDLRKSFNVLSENRSYKYTITSLTIVSGVNYVLSNLNPILLYQVSKSYETFAILTNILTGISLLSIYIIRQRLISKINKFKLVFTSSLTIAIFSIFIFFNPLIYLVAFYVTSPLIYPVIDVYNWNIMNRSLLVNFLINRQIFLNSGRIFFSVIEVFLGNLLLSEQMAIVLPALIVASVIFYKGKKEISF
ncbi:hypothetical protein DFR86_04485 [Acidianus sulfidivorans JP7]|uniref:MFS transporter n=1 Tax=Acidianus sulfidivorans JP7 TaxID=619593 RepID=A0A2U9ILJ0_9CREN|nr:hypothetical protein [Acidianus sulfidivorans]AWR96886.1 hypothetical protein DFR86_04485 [Acidianus sulfidivorans JP7]